MLLHEKEGLLKMRLMHERGEVLKYDGRMELSISSIPPRARKLLGADLPSVESPCDR